MKARLFNGSAFLISIALLAPFWLGRAQPGGLPSAASSVATITNDAQNVEFISQIGGSTYAVAVQGNYAYIGVGPRLIILNISNPLSPAVVGKTLPLPSIVRCVAVAGNYAYVADENADLRVVDVSDPTHPREVGVYITPEPGEGSGVVVAGGYAYVVGGTGYPDYDGWLWVVNVSDPTNPRGEGLYDTPGSASDVAVAGRYAYVVGGAGSPDYDGWLQMVDVSIPTQPTKVGSYDTQEPVSGVAVAGDYVYFTDREALRVVEVSDPNKLKEVDSCDIWEPHGVVVVGRYAYVIGDEAIPESGWLLVVDIFEPTDLRVVGSYTSLRWINDVAVTKDYVYLIDQVSGLGVVNVSDPTNPTEVGFYDMSRHANDVTIAEGYAYVADGGAGLRVVDVSGPTNPREVGFYEMRFGIDVAIAEDYVYVVISGRGFFADLQVVDVSDPTNPTGMGSPGLGGNAWDVAVAGRYAYVVGNTGYPYYNSWLKVVDVSDPTNPTKVSSYNTPGDASGVAVARNYVYVADGGAGLRVINVSDPTNPTEVSSCDTPGDAYGVAVAGGYAYVVGGTGFPDYDGWLWVVNVSEPANPRIEGSYDTPGSASDIAVVGRYAYVADGSAGLRVMNVSNSANLTEVGFYDTSGDASGVAVACDYVYVADGDGGLSILRYTVGSCISGRVADLSGNPIEGAQVSTSDGHSVITDANGQYTFITLPAGTYTLTPAPGYFWSPTDRIVTVPPSAVGQDFTGQNILKQATPSSAHVLGYDEPLTYTVRLVYPNDLTLKLYDRMPTYTTYINGSLNGPAGVTYDLASNAISGTLSLIAGDTETVTFTVRVGVTGTVDFAPLITNRACAYPVEEGLVGCTWSNEVHRYTYAWLMYLLLILRQCH